MITIMQLKKCARKGCTLFLVQSIETDSISQKPSIEDYTILREFRDVFPKEIINLQPKRNIDFIIDLIPRSTPLSKHRTE